MLSNAECVPESKGDRPAHFLVPILFAWLVSLEFAHGERFLQLAPTHSPHSAVDGHAVLRLEVDPGYTTRVLELDENQSSL